MCCLTFFKNNRGNFLLICFETKWQSQINSHFPCQYVASPFSKFSFDGFEVFTVPKFPQKNFETVNFGIGKLRDRKLRKRQTSETGPPVFIFDLFGSISISFNSRNSSLNWQQKPERRVGYSGL